MLFNHYVVFNQHSLTNFKLFSNKLPTKSQSLISFPFAIPRFKSLHITMSGCCVRVRARGLHVLLPVPGERACWHGSCTRHAALYNALLNEIKKKVPLYLKMRRRGDKVVDGKLIKNVPEERTDPDPEPEPGSCACGVWWLCVCTESEILARNKKVMARIRAAQPPTPRNKKVMARIRAAQPPTPRGFDITTNQHCFVRDPGPWLEHSLGGDWFRNC